MERNRRPSAEAAHRRRAREYRGARPSRGGAAAHHPRRHRQVAVVRGARAFEGATPMVEERRSALTESELDAGLAEALAAEPSPDFAARVRARIADQKVPTTGPFAYLAAAAALGAAGIGFVMLVVERR